MSTDRPHRPIPPGPPTAACQAPGASRLHRRAGSRETVGSQRRNQSVSLLAVWVVLACTVTGPLWGQSTPGGAELDFFETRIRPLLLQRCGDCHGAEVQEADLRVDTWWGMLAGGPSGQLIDVDQPERSLLLSVIDYRDPSLQMPPDGRLPQREIDLLSRWLQMGAPHPEAGREPESNADRPASPPPPPLWSLEPIRLPPVPTPTDSTWVQTPIDAFLWERFEQHGLEPAQEADRRTLIRRLTLGLIGLPPTPQEVDTFVADRRPDAYERLIDRLLASPAYGQHWGRNWLDIARYADSNGLDENIAHGNAWRYRDYVIDALNRDKPIDRFIMEQLAGDLLSGDQNAGDPLAGDGDAHRPPLAGGAGPAPGPVDRQRAEQLIATGFLSLGPKVLAEADQTKMRMDIIDEQIDTLGRSLLGLTLGCARCHDHKFDPISTRDYYALAGILGSTQTMESLATIARWHETPIPDRQQWQVYSEVQQQLSAAKVELEQLGPPAAEPAATPEPKEPDHPGAEAAAAASEAAAQTAQRRETLQTQIKQLEESLPALPSAMSVCEAPAVADMPIHVRGSHLTLGAVVPRGLPQILLGSQPPLEIPPGRSGRLELAQWLVSEENPLTRRVLANRLWRWHFGRGLVSSVDNFGRLGTPPTHPELLDWLAGQWLTHEWSLKALQRQLLRSSLYQRSSQPQSASAAVDPDNLWWWRFEPRRLSAESLRDSTLAVAGELDGSFGGSMLHVDNRQFLFDHTSKDTTSYDSPRRSIYLPVIRNHLFEGFSLFDYNAADVVQGDRHHSVVPPQSLYWLNSPLILQAAERLASHVAQVGGADTDERIVALYRQCLGRSPSSLELQQAARFIAQFPDSPEPHETPQVAAAWTALSQCLLISSEFVYQP
jgi:cytochrome c553